MYARLLEYIQQFGTCEISQSQSNSLHSWIYKQRVKYANGLLDPHHQERLIAVGVDLTRYQPSAPKPEQWEKRFTELCTFREQYGHCNVGDPHKEHKTLKKFVAKQRTRYKMGVLQQYRIEKLLSIGFEFERKYAEGMWQRQFDKLVAYKNKHGHLHVDYKTDYELSKFVEHQQSRFRKKRLEPVRYQKLVSIGFQFTESRDSLFEARMCKLVDWYHQHHHFNFERDSELHKFANRLRANYRRNYLSADVILRLQAIEFNFQFQQRNTDIKETRLKQLTEFVKLNGHCEVNKSNEMFEGLSEWLTDQRKHRKQGKLTTQHANKLEALGMIWSYKKKWREDSWSSKYERLLSIYKKTCTTLLISEEDENLRGWCTLQRKFFRLGKLSKERIEKLEAIGFAWDVLETEWTENYAALLAFKSRYGHCRVTETLNRKLNVWCGNVKKSMKEGKLSAERKTQLDAIGFLWDVHEVFWQDKYNCMKEYLQKNSWADLHAKNRSLFLWISNQRKTYKRKTLSEEKIMLLNMLGIDWHPQHGSRNLRLEKAC